jgi:hypothetical protein
VPLNPSDGSVGVNVAVGVKVNDGVNVAVGV